MRTTSAIRAGLLLVLVMSTSLAAEPKKDAPAKKNVEPKKTVSAVGTLTLEFGMRAAAPVASEISSGVLSGESPASVKIEKTLDEPTELVFIEAPLTDVIAFLTNKHRIEIQLDNKAFEEAGVAMDTQITRNLKNVALRSALNLMLNDMELTYLIRNEVLLITTVSNAETIMSTRIYAVGDLLHARGQPTNSQSLAERLSDIIMGNVAPTTWNEVGGAGAIKYWPGGESLVISQTYSQHRELRDLLTALRKSHGLQPPKSPEQAAGEQSDRPYVAIYRLPRRILLPAEIQFSHATPPGGAWAPPGRAVVEDLAKAIPKLVDPKSWKATNNEHAPLIDPPSGSKEAAGQGTIEIVGNELLVLQTAKVHRQIAEFLQNFAAANEMTSGS